MQEELEAQEEPWERLALEGRGGALGANTSLRILSYSDMNNVPLESRAR